MSRKFTLQAESPSQIRELSPEFAEDLNTEQQRAVTWGAGPVLVVAGAGTGKTRTLVYRVAYLVESGVQPENIVLLTFTRRAATEMVNRAASLLDGRCQRVQGGTFHAFCLGILKKYATKIGFPSNFTVLDASDSADVIDVLRSRLSSDIRGKRFPRKRTLQNMFSALRNRGMKLDVLLDSSYPHFVEYSATIERLFQEYATFKKEQGLMDYDDLLVLTLMLFQSQPAVLREVASRCKYVLVDEYQDTNRAQALLVKAFGSVHGNVMAVGDDAQSIYRFRGADQENILSFPDQFSTATVLKLEHNYRSSQSILDLANHILASARKKYAKELFTERGKGDLPALVPAPDDRFESRFVSQMILQMREQGVALNDMAVLFRNGHNSYDLEVELNRKNIPFVKYGGLKLSEAAHIKDVLAHLKVVENPKDAIAWNRVLQLLEGVGPKTAGRILEWLETDTAEPFVLKERPYSAAYIESLRSLFAMLRRIHSSDMPPSVQIELILEYYAPILRRVYSEDYPKREPDMEHFVGVASQFSDRATLLDSLALDPIDLTAIDVDPEENDEPPLVLSTIHSAKGLEFNTVFLIQALDGVMPSSYSVGDEAAIEEELRLMYVAVTRAEDQLFISYPMIQFRRYEGQYFTKPSRFLAEIPSTLLEPCTLVEESSANAELNGPAQVDEIDEFLAQGLPPGPADQ